MLYTISMPEEQQFDFNQFTPIHEKKGVFNKIRLVLLQNTILTVSIVIILLVFISVLIFFISSKNSRQKFYETLSINKTLSTNTITSQPTATKTDGEKLELIGFLPYWMVAQEAEVYPERLGQIIYFGLGVDKEGRIIKQNEEGVYLSEWNYLNLDYFDNLKSEAQSTDTKLLIAIKCFDNETIEKIISNQTVTNNLVSQVIELIDTYDFDGVNIDFEYFTSDDYPTTTYFNRFLETLSSSLHEKNPNLIVSVDVYADAVLIDGAYDLVKMGEVVDQVILMGYDYHRADSNRSGPVAPINSDNETSIAESLDSLIGRTPIEKVILGIPFYGYEWQTLNDQHRSTTVANTGAIATYKRVRDLVENRQDVEINWDSTAASPWLTYKQSGAIKQIYYEDGRSISEKVKFAKIKKLGGIAIWALGYEGDDKQLWELIEGGL